MMTYGNGAQVNYTYDIYNRVRSKTAGGWTETYDYDASGNISHLHAVKTDGTERNITYEYDSIGRLMWSVETDENQHITRSVENEYDSKNRLTAYRYSNGLTTRTQRFTYRADGKRKTAATVRREPHCGKKLKNLQITIDKQAAYVYNSLG